MPTCRTARAKSCVTCLCRQNLEEINVLRITLDTQIEDLEQHFETAHINYLQVKCKPHKSSCATVHARRWACSLVYIS